MQEKMDGFDSILNFQLETQMDNRVGGRCDYLRAEGYPLYLSDEGGTADLHQRMQPHEIQPDLPVH